MESHASASRHHKQVTRERHSYNRLLKSLCGEQWGEAEQGVCSANSLYWGWAEGEWAKGAPPTTPNVRLFLLVLECRVLQPLLELSLNTHPPWGTSSRITLSPLEATTLSGRFGLLFYKHATPSTFYKHTTLKKAGDMKNLAHSNLISTLRWTLREVIISNCGT